jgi:hypothetical protein
MFLLPHFLCSSWKVQVCGLRIILYVAKFRTHLNVRYTRLYLNAYVGVFWYVPWVSVSSWIDINV